MGMADIIPGVSGGTIAFITGIYEELIKAISSFDQSFFKLILSLEFKEAFRKIPIKFLLILFSGIISAILLSSRVIHFLLESYAIYTWSFFFGLILSSVLFLGKKIEKPLKSENLFSFILGTVVGAILVSLVPVETSNHLMMVFLSGAIAICAMILPGISGSFLLLIMGKYAYITGALKNPFENLTLILTFCLGCLLGMISFSKFIKWSLKSYNSIMMAILTGFMLGSLKKVWPWKKVIESKIIRGKLYVLQEKNYFPEIESSLFIALAFFILGFILVQILERSNRGVSSAG